MIKEQVSLSIIMMKYWPRKAEVNETAIMDFAKYIKDAIV